MKSFSALLLALFTATAFAHAATDLIELNPKIENYDQVEYSQMDGFLDRGIVIVTYNLEAEEVDKNIIVRLYKFKNSRIKKALAFTTKRDKTQTV